VSKPSDLREGSKEIKMALSRGARIAVGLTILTILTVGDGNRVASAGSSSDEIQIAHIVPLTGPWADLGQMEDKGAQMAAQEINDAGGIKALGGRKIKLVTADAGGTPESAKNATQRLISGSPELVAGMGVILSSMTLAATTVTEREKLPLITQSYATSVTDRGLKYVFQIVPNSKTIATETFPILAGIARTATGKAPSKVAIIRDNTAASQDFFKPLLGGGFKEIGLTLAVDAAYTPPLSDATAIALKVRSSGADFVFLFITALPDVKRVLEALAEFNIKLPITAQAATLGMPGVLDSVRKEALEGLISTAGVWPGAKQASIAKNFAKFANQPWMPEPALAGYAGTWIIKEALERSASTSREELGKALHEMDLTSGPAASAIPTGRIKFDESGRLVSPVITAFEWLDGKPLTVYPEPAAEAKPVWPMQ
jgi:branched-chain amino acid transport system substrate-binding protein